VTTDSVLWSRLSAHAGEIALSAAIFVVSLVASLALAGYMLCRLPTDYLTLPDSRIPKVGFAARSPLARVAQNVLGVVLVIVGVVLSLPGVPGQGVLTILVGLMLLDLPVMRRLERRILTRPTVLRAVNGLRQRRGRPPLDDPQPA
jgi:hypothetical protein